MPSRRLNARNGVSTGNHGLKLQAYLPYRLSVAANAVSRLIARAYQDRFALKIPEWRLIAVLADEGALTQQALCGQTLMDKVTVLRAAHGLLRRHLIRRLPHARDRRSHRLELTPAGARMYRQIAPLALAYEARLLAGIPAREAARLHQLLRRLEERAGRL